MAPGLPRTPPQGSPRRDSRGSTPKLERDSESSTSEIATSHLGSLEGRLAAGLAPVRQALRGSFTEMSLHARLAEPRIESLLPKIPPTRGSTIDHGVGGAELFAEPDNGAL